MNYIPKKEEMMILKFLSTQERCDGGKKSCLSEELKIKLNLDHSILTEILTSGTPYLGNNDGKTWITSQGDAYIENYNYERFKEISYWIFGFGSLVAAIYSVLTYYCK